MKSNKEIYYAVICPTCGWKTVGNWKDAQYQDYLEHFWEEHCPKPYIKTTKETINKPTCNAKSKSKRKQV